MTGPVSANNPLLGVIDELLRMQGCFESLFSNVPEGASLTTLQKMVLFAVFEAPVPPTVPQIGRELGHPRQVIQRIVNEMVAADILEKHENPHHKRAMLLLPTTRARAMKEQAEARALETADAFLGQFNVARCLSLKGELKGLREALEAYVKERGGSELSHEPRSTFALLERLG